MKKLPVVYLEWLDSCTNYGWRNPEEGHLSKIRSIGFLVKEDKHSLTITTSASLNGQAVDQITIPKVVVSKRKKIKI